jgi:hypothetical protein
MNSAGIVTDRASAPETPCGISCKASTAMRTSWPLRRGLRHSRVASTKSASRILWLHGDARRRTPFRDRSGRFLRRGHKHKRPGRGAFRQASFGRDVRFVRRTISRRLLCRVVYRPGPLSNYCGGRKPGRDRLDSRVRGNDDVSVLAYTGCPFDCVWWGISGKTRSLSRP